MAFFCSKIGLTVKSVHSLHNADIHQEPFVYAGTSAGLVFHNAIGESLPSYQLNYR